MAKWAVQRRRLNGHSSTAGVFRIGGNRLGRSAPVPSSTRALMLVSIILRPMPDDTDSAAPELEALVRPASEPLLVKSLRTGSRDVLILSGALPYTLPIPRSSEPGITDCLASRWVTIGSLGSHT